MGRKRKYPKHKQKSPKWFQKENDWGDYVFDWTLGLGSDTWRDIFAILILILSVVLVLGFFSASGGLGTGLLLLARKLFGIVPSYILPIVTFWIGIIVLFPNKKQQRLSRFIGFLLFMIFIAAFFHLFIPEIDTRASAVRGLGGGIIGYMVSDPLRRSVGLFATFIISIALLAVSLMMIFNFSFSKFFGLKGKEEEEEDGKGKLKINKGLEHKEEEKPPGFFSRMFSKLTRRGRRNIEVIEPKAPVMEIESKELSRGNVWQYPSLDLLKTSEGEANPGNIEKNVKIIEKTLENFGIKIYMGSVNVGPTVSQYCFKPEDGVKLNQITARSNDLALALASRSLRMEAPIPGKSSVGVEIPNAIPARVTLKEVLGSKEFMSIKSKLGIALGRDVSGEPVVVDLETMPHILIAGATGSGKSVCINAVISSFLFKNSPADLRLIMVDPKRVELTNYNGIPHLLTPVITEVDQTISALKWGIWEMERRYKMFSELGKRNIIAYNESPGSEGKLPYLVIVIDELADLMATSANDVEGSIVRLAQMARATGIHLIIATQRPSVDVLTGLIKANITSRIAFASASQVDSRTILDMSGAEKLLGNGDMLFLGNGLSKPKRIQGCFISDAEIETLTKFLREQSMPNYDDSVLHFRTAKSGGVFSGEGGADDEMYDDAVRVVSEHGKASASLLQRRLRVGYARAARLLDILEENGVIGPADGARPRDVLISTTGSEAFQPRNDEPEDEYENHFR